MTTVQTKTNHCVNFTLNVSNPNLSHKNSANLDSFQTISTTHGKQGKIDTTTHLPVNFFHAPGEYNKMLIKCQAPSASSAFDRKMGVVRNLEFMNEPLFEKEKEKRNDRVR